MRPSDRQAPAHLASASASGSSSAHHRRSRAPSTSTSSPLSSSCVAAESYLRLKKKGALTWSTRYLVLRNAQLACFYSKQDAEAHRAPMELWTVERAAVTKLRGEAGLTVATADGKELTARTFNRSELAQWLTAFHRLDVKREAKKSAGMALPEAHPEEKEENKEKEKENEKRKGRESDIQELSVSSPKKKSVTFYGSVKVRTIPAVAEEQRGELFYSRKEMEQFSMNASSLLCRTETAMNRAFLSLRRPRATA